ncbi:MAG: NAD(P)-dependent oxidoreductase [Anaerolineales bacterium]
MRKENERIRIVNAEPLGYCDEARDVLNQVGEIVEIPLDRAQLLAQLPDTDVLIVRLAHQIDREAIDAGAHLRVISSATTGLDHIDLDYARLKGIEVLSLQGEMDFLRTVSATAEHTWALLLALVRRIPAAFASVRAGSWNRDSFRGYELNGQRLGLVGLGRVARNVARFGMAFSMEVAAFDPDLADWLDGVRRCRSLPELMRRSEVLSLHVPLNPGTVGLIGADELALLPPGTVLINTSRGDLVEEGALVHALRSGALAGAALDFLPGEREPERRLSSPLLTYACDHDNLIITPHIAGATHESMAKTEIFMAHKLASFLRSRQARVASL